MIESDQTHAPKKLFKIFHSEGKKISYIAFFFDYI